MAGTLVTVLQRKRLEYSFLPGGASQTMTLVPELATCNWVFLALYVRVHERNMVSGQSLAFKLYNILPSPHDAREFVEDSSGVPNPFLTVTLTSTLPGAVPGIRVGSMTGSGLLGPFVKITLTANQTSVSDTFYSELSAEVLLRETR